MTVTRNSKDSRTAANKTPVCLTQRRGGRSFISLIFVGLKCVNTGKNQVRKNLTSLHRVIFALKIKQCLIINTDIKRDNCILRILIQND